MQPIFQDRPAQDVRPSYSEGLRLRAGTLRPLSPMDQRILIADMDKCSGCRSCVVACSLAKEASFSEAKSRIQVEKKEEVCLGIPFLCEHCTDAPCMASCPVQAIHRETETGITRVQFEKCTGCGACVDVCPFNGVRLDAERNVALICDLCDGNPVCVETCVSGGIGALQFVERNETNWSVKMGLAQKRVNAFRYSSR